jgi:class 3 adenylate cyclase/HAMP domain-containing protein
VRIRAKIILVVLPLIITPLAIIALASVFTARTGITRVATEFLQFKADELATYAASQWALLEDNGLSGRAEFVEISRQSIASFARSMVRSESELILAVDRSGRVAMSTREVTVSPEELTALAELAGRKAAGWQPSVRVGGVQRVAQAVPIDSFGWHVLITQGRDVFYRATNLILEQSVIVLAAAALVSVVLLLLLSGFLTRPVRSVAAAMQTIIASGELSRRVPLTYHDETGDLAHVFNIMTGELERAYNAIKGYALESVIARRAEQKTRTVFQKYVPREVIDLYIRNPESMLVGKNEVLAVLFSDIRGFTTISERMVPEQIVESLNAYFATMVDIITESGGTVDKYMGDCIMALYGAPVRHDDDALRAVRTALEMLDRLPRFNAEQQKKKRPSFAVGIGIAYGIVTVGNIGSDKKMDYTVIGDMVNLASRLEGLTKVYHEQLLFSDAVRHRVETVFPCRRVDKVAVKGKRQPVDIYTARPSLTPAEKEAWEVHARALELYFGMEFEKAADLFSRVRAILPHDELSQVFFERCRLLIHNPPGQGWNGTVVIREK